jgi:hypothetical protein
MIQDLLDRAQLNAWQKMPFAVEHKHTFSSCRGTLRITGEGVEFKTTETDHSFYEAYGNLRDFTMDGNGISIRTRNNKKYNFRLINVDESGPVQRLIAHYSRVSQ